VTHGLEEVAKKVIAAFAVERIIEWGKRIVEGAEAMGHLAQQTGSSTESLSTWSYVLKIATVSQEEFNLGMKDAARFLGDLDRGSAQAIETMRSLGLAGQSFKTLDEFLFAVSDRFKELPDGLRKTQDAITIFGRSGQQMIPVLNQGAEAIKATQQKARDLGLEISTGFAHNAEEFNTGMTRITEAAKGLGIQIVGNLLPSMVEFVNELADTKEHATATAGTINTLADAIRGFLTVVLALYYAIKILGEALAALLFTSLTPLVTTVKLLVTLFQNLVDTIGKVKDAAVAALKSLQGLGDTLEFLKAGDIKGALFNIAEVLGEVGQEGANAGQAVWNNWGKALDSIWSSAKSILPNVGGLWKRVYGDALADAEAFADKWLTLWGQGVKPPSAEKGPTGKDSFAPVPMTGDDVKLIDDIDQRWRESFKNKREQLDFNFQYEKMQIEELEILGLQSAEETQKTITKLTQVYGKQREDLARQEESARATIELSRIQGERTRIDTNTDVTKAEKKQILLALLAKENDLIEKQLKTYELLVKDETKTDETRIEAAKQLVTLEQQKTEVMNKQRELQRDNFVGQMRTQLVQLQDEWSNLGANLATGVIGGIKTAVQGIGDAIMGVIDGTKTWGQVFAQVGRSIIATIIQIVLQWIISMTLLRVLKAIFGSEDKTAASASAIAWAPAAVAASIASYGAAAAAGGIAFSAAMVAGTALAGWIVRRRWSVQRGRACVRRAAADYRERERA
jgi:mannose/fructose/N-acetylgalactosamine-specific phosphotransferase system component IID